MDNRLKAKRSTPKFSVSARKRGARAIRFAAKKVLNKRTGQRVEISPIGTKSHVASKKKPIGPNPLLNIIGIYEGEEDGSVNHDHPNKLIR